MAYNGYVGIGYQLNMETNEYEKCVGDIYGSHLDTSYRYYQNEHPQMAKGEYSSNFEFDGMVYPGHITLDDLFKAVELNMEGASEYDHLIVTDEIKNYVEEY